MEVYESVLLVKPEVFVFNIPPRSTNRNYRAADWNLSAPSWTGRMRLVAKDKECCIKLEDKSSGELFAKCPIETYPGIALETVSDSSRYFVLRIQDDNGRTAYIGLGFGDRSDSFDLNVALQDHFKWVKMEQQISEEPAGGVPSLDLGFKEGQTIKIDMKITKRDGEQSKAKSRPTGGLGLLPPPPGGSGRLPAPPGSSPAGSPAHAPKPTDASGGGESWGEFTSATGATPAPQQPSPSANNANWVQF